MDLILSSFSCVRFIKTLGKAFLRQVFLRMSDDVVGGRVLGNVDNV